MFLFVYYTIENALFQVEKSQFVLDLQPKRHIAQLLCEKIVQYFFLNSEKSRNKIIAVDKIWHLLQKFNKSKHGFCNDILGFYLNILLLSDSISKDFKEAFESVFTLIFPKKREHCPDNDTMLDKNTYRSIYSNIRLLFLEK